MPTLCDFCREPLEVGTLVSGYDTVTWNLRVRPHLPIWMQKEKLELHPCCAVKLLQHDLEGNYCCWKHEDRDVF